MCIKNMMAAAKEMSLDRSFNAHVGISRSGQDLKSVSIHKSASTPLWKIALFLLGAIMLLCVIKKCCCKKEKSE